MNSIDPFSYQLGIIDCFNEMVRAGVKRLALSHPCSEKEERDRLMEASQPICRQYGTHMYAEDASLITDLFPVSMNQGKYNILFYIDEDALRQYLSLKEQKQALIAGHQYVGKARTDLAIAFGKLLSYSPEGIRRLLASNPERE